MTPPLTFSAKSARTPQSPISHFMELALGNPDLISLAAGLVDGASLPAGPVKAAIDDILGDPAAARAALQYGTTRGYGPLLDEIVRHVAGLDGKTPAEFGVTPRDAMVTTGSQQLLYMLGEVLFDPGDIVLTEAPSYFVYHSVLASTGVRVVTVPMDDDGLIPEELDHVLAGLEGAGELGRVKLLYSVDYFQNPTGLTLSAERRPRVVEIIRRYSKAHRILILEDAAYRELRYDGNELFSLKSFDVDNRHVIYAGTFSKPCSPGLKTGYALMPHELIEPLVRLKGNHDFGSNNLSQHVLYRLMKSGAYAKHVEYLRGVYRTKRDTMLAALDGAFGDWPEVTWTRPRGGMFVWFTLPEDIATSEGSVFLKAALAEGVLYIPGEFGHVSETGPVPKNEARLSYGDATVEQIKAGVKRLRKAADAARRAGVARAEAVPV